MCPSAPRVCSEPGGQKAGTIIVTGPYWQVALYVIGWSIYSLGNPSVAMHSKQLISLFFKVH